MTKHQSPTTLTDTQRIDRLVIAVTILSFFVALLFFMAVLA